MTDDTIRVDPADIRTLRVAELEILEERTGRPLSRLFDEDAPRGALLHALAYIMLRRQDPDATWEQAGDRVVILGGEEDAPGADPTRRGKARGRHAA